MDAQILIRRNKEFVLKILQLCRTLPKTMESQIIAKQLLRSATSFASNYRAACRARSNAEFYAKMCIVVEEVDEANFWMDLLIDSGIENSKVAGELLNESLELTKIYSASRKSAQRK